MKTKLGKSTRIWNLETKISNKETNLNSPIFFGSDRIKEVYDLEEIETSIRIALSTRENQSHEILKIYLIQKGTKTEMVIRPIDPKNRLPRLPIHSDTLSTTEKMAGSIILIKDQKCYRAVTIEEYLKLIGIDISQIKNPIRKIIDFGGKFPKPKLHQQAKSPTSTRINTRISVCQ